MNPDPAMAALRHARRVAVEEQAHHEQHDNNHGDTALGDCRRR